ncbi:hypothetical protein CR969_01965 [Candidatus Saccharibacteria bacterium]|nr:MAG: hypothetical protein CR969_01965 [Candidatus Saccharibacteria bacterium]
MSEIVAPEGYRAVPKSAWPVKENGEYVMKQSYRFERDLSDVFDIDVMHVEPLGKRPRNENYKVILMVSDAQIGYRNIDNKLYPIHDEKAIAVATRFAGAIGPDVLVDGGDTTDFPDLSTHFDPDSDQFRGVLNASFQRTHNYFGDLTEATPGAERHTVDSNHVKRFADFVIKRAMPLYGIKRVGEDESMLAYKNILQLDKIGWEFHGTYGTAEYRYKPDLAFTHGTLAVANGSTSYRLGNKRGNHNRNIIQGHSHRAEATYNTDPQTRQMYLAATCPVLCRIDGYVPSYNSSVDPANGQPTKYYENWQQGALVIYDYEDGHYQFNFAMIDDEYTIRYNGKRYT